MPAVKVSPFRETKLVELKISDNSQPCLMTCYLDYRKEGSTEILEGTFTSVVEKQRPIVAPGMFISNAWKNLIFTKRTFCLKTTCKNTTTGSKNDPTGQ